MSTSQHDRVARGIAKKRGGSYNKGAGADIKTPQCAIEVETADTVADASRQLRGYKKPVYVAGADPDAVKKALQHYGGTTIGVMNSSGDVIKRSTRKKH